jgi:hypothetical protein
MTALHETRRVALHPIIVCFQECPDQMPGNDGLL